MKAQSRAAQMAATFEQRLKDMGQMPKVKQAKPEPEQETPEQLSRRAALKAKLRAFAE